MFTLNKNHVYLLEEDQGNVDCAFNNYIDCINIQGAL